MRNWIICKDLKFILVVLLISKIKFSVPNMIAVDFLF